MEYQGSNFQQNVEQSNINMQQNVEQSNINMQQSILNNNDSNNSFSNFSNTQVEHGYGYGMVLFSKLFYVSLGYNYRRADELSASSSKWEGLSVGAGVSIKGFKFGASYSHLHVSSSSLLFNVSYTL